MTGDKDPNNNGSQPQAHHAGLRPPARVLPDRIALLANLAALTTFCVVILSLLASRMLLNQYESLYHAQILAPVITRFVSNQIIVFFTTSTAVVVLFPVFISLILAFLFQGHIEDLKGNPSITWPLWSILFTVVAITVTLRLFWERGYVALVFVAALAAFVWIVTVFGGFCNAARTICSPGSRRYKALVVLMALVMTVFLVVPLTVVFRLVRIKATGHLEIAVLIASFVAVLMSLAGSVFRLGSGLGTSGLARGATIVSVITGFVAYLVVDHAPGFVMAITGYGGFHIEYRLKGSKVSKRGILILQAPHALYLEPFPARKLGRHWRLYEVRLTHIRWWGRSLTSKGTAHGGRPPKEPLETRIILR